MALSEIDKQLLKRCLDREPRAWEDFVDRFVGLVVHVVNHTGSSRSIQISEQDREDFTAEVFLSILGDDFAALKRFRGASSLATYLTVIARRVVVRELLKRKISAVPPGESGILQRQAEMHHKNGNGYAPSAEERFDNRDEVQKLMDSLPQAEAEVVRLYHLEGKSYHEISAHMSIPENSIGPTLSRARARMRQEAMGSSSVH
ncbi:MAG: sigma-70 family RNA polymerase sigma factor [Pirellulaceae bacterium]|nr:sigma-70 family RNA polymerase sigma factor [Pirellulaceae bacterium]